MWDFNRYHGYSHICFPSQRSRSMEAGLLMFIWCLNGMFFLFELVRNFNISQPLHFTDGFLTLECCCAVEIAVIPAEMWSQHEPDPIWMGSDWSECILHALTISMVFLESYWGYRLHVYTKCKWSESNACHLAAPSPHLSFCSPYSKPWQVPQARGLLCIRGGQQQWESVSRAAPQWWVPELGLPFIRGCR